MARIVYINIVARLCICNTSDLFPSSSTEWQVCKHCRCVCPNFTSWHLYLYTWKNVMYNFPDYKIISLDINKLFFFGIFWFNCTVLRSPYGSCATSSDTCIYFFGTNSNLKIFFVRNSQYRNLNRKLNGQEQTFFFDEGTPGPVFFLSEILLDI